jgi:pimeloyl-ACP methyl ester carboxylesterase
MSTHENVRFETQDKLNLSGIFDIPEKAKNFVIMAHGLGMNKDEWNNLHFRISQDLNMHQIATLRFDFRGHGDSEGSMKDMTVAGQLLDLHAAVNEVQKKWKKPVAFLASSFGAPPVIYYASIHPEDINSIALLNPVLDYDATFLNPVVEWAAESFNKDGYKHLSENGYLMLDNNQLGAKLITEFKLLKPFQTLSTLKCPVLTIHGDKDSMVPYAVAKKYGEPNRHSNFIPIKKADHGFVDWEDEEGTNDKSAKNQKKVTEHIIEWVAKWSK